MPKILLTGLHGRDSLPYRAALGLVQALQEVPGWEGSRLGWEGSEAVLEGPGTREELLGSLVDFYSKRHQDPRWFWPGQEKEKVKHKGTQAQYVSKVREFESHRYRLAWLRGTATDQVLKTKEGVQHTAPTAWATYTGGSHHSPLHDASDIMKRLAEHPSLRVAIEGTLFGPWKNQEDLHPLGWDHTQNADNATRGRSLSDKDPKQTELFAFALAMESLALYPVHARNGRAHTTGFSNSETCFTYPLWTKPMTPRSITALLDHPLLHVDKVVREQLKWLGITRVFRGNILPDSNSQGKCRRVSVSRRIA